MRCPFFKEEGGRKLCTALGRPLRAYIWCKESTVKKISKCHRYVRGMGRKIKLVEEIL